MLLLFTLFPLVLYVTGREPDNVLYLPGSFVYKLFLIDAWWTGHAISWNVPSWSISAEVFAYLAFPFLLRPFPGLRLPFVMILAFTLLLTLAAVCVTNGLSSIGNSIAQFGIIRCVIEFVVGIAIFFITSDARVQKSGHGNVLIIAALAIMVLGPYADVADYWYMPLTFMLILIGMLTCNGMLHRVLEHKLLVYLGEISYSVYLTHFFVIDFMGKAFLRNGQTAGASWLIACVLVTLVFSAVTYRFVERSSRRYLVAKAQRLSQLTR